MARDIKIEYRLVHRGPLSLLSVPPLHVQVRHKHGMVEGLDHKHVELLVMCSLEVDWFGVPQPAKMVRWGAPWSLLSQGPHNELRRAGGYQR